MNKEEEKYRNREIDQKFNDVHEKLDRNSGEAQQKLDKILVQTTRTNGRVDKLENWKSFTQGGLALMTALLIPILILLIQIYLQK